MRAGIAELPLEHIMDNRKNAARLALGFSLIELMVTVSIVGVLAAVGYPSYQEYIIRSNRQVARSALFQVADRQEQFFLDNKRYADGLDELGMGGDELGLDREGHIGAEGDEVIYTVSFDDADATSWSLIAAPEAMQAERDTDCATLTLLSTGERGSTGGGDNCW